MNRLLLTGGSTFLSLALFAGEVTWTGGGTGWSDPASWGGTVPGDTDTAVFTQAATVAPPASFAGVIKVTAGVKVTANVAEATRFKVRLDAAGSEFAKTGSGDLTLSAAYGVQQGMVTAAEGKLLLAWNGEEEAPGAFGLLVVKSGATAEVAESPIDRCHGCIYRIGRTTANVSWGKDQYKNIYQTNTYAEYLDGWNLDSGRYLNSITNKTVLYVPPADGAALNAQAGYPSDYGFDNWDYRVAGDIINMARALVLEETDALRNNYILAHQKSSKIGYSLFHNEAHKTGRFADSNLEKINPLKTSGTRGWAAYDFLILQSFDQWGRKTYPVFSCDALVPGGHERLTPGVLWSGVCANAVTVESGATFKIADGQAFSIGNARQFKMNGSFVSGGANTLFYLGTDWSVEAGDAKLKTAALKDFGGTVEIAPTSKLGGGDGAPADGCVITGSGELTVTDGNKSHIDAAFNGPIVVGEGSTYDLPADFELPEEMTDLEGSAPFGSETWQINNKTEWVSDGTAVHILENHGDGTCSRGSVVCKTGIPVYCPFEFSCDVIWTGASAYNGFTKEGQDANFGLLVQTMGPNITCANSWNSRLPYMLPNAGEAFGFHVGTYYGTVGFVTNSVEGMSDDQMNKHGELYDVTLTQNHVWSFADGVPARYTLTYDGLGTFKARVQTPKGDVTAEFTDSRLAGAKYTRVEKFYPSVLARQKDSMYVGTIVVSNLSVKVADAPLVAKRHVEVEDGATLRVKGPDQASVRFSDLKLGDGATLFFAPYFTGLASGISTEGLTVTGEATVEPQAGENLTTTVGDFTSRNGGSIKVSGDVEVEEPLTVSVSRSELKALKGPVTVLDATAAAPVPAVDLTKVTLDDIDQSGKRMTLEYADGLLKANATFGLLMLVR